MLGVAPVCFSLGMRHYEPGRLCAAMAATQHGLITRAQAVAAGVTPRSIDGRVRSGQWRIVLPRIYEAEEAPRTFEQDLMAATLWAGEDSAGSHRSAAAMLRLAGIPRRTLEISTPRKLRANNITVHRTRENLRSCSTEAQGIPVTTAARTLVDLGAVVSPETLEIALDDGLRRRLCSVSDLEIQIEILSAKGRAGPRSLRPMLLVRREAGVALESPLPRLLRLMLRAKLPMPVPQYPIIANGELHARADFAYPSARIAIEADGNRYHFTQADRDNDRYRSNRAHRRRVDPLSRHLGRFRQTPRESHGRNPGVAAPPLGGLRAADVILGPGNHP